MVVVRGDHRVNEIKLAQRARRAVPPRAARTRSPSASARPASSGPVGADAADPARRGRRARRRTSSAPTAPDAHLRGVEPGRDFAFERVDVRTRRGGRHASTATRSAIEPAIEVGNIFKLGTRYSEPLGATYLDETGSEQLDLDGLLRHRPGAHRRRRGRAVRRRAGHLLAARDRAVGRRARRARQAGHARARRRPSALYEELRAAGLEVLLRRPRRRARARSSPTPSCSACPLRLTVGTPLAGVRARPRRRCAAGATDVEGGVPLRGRRGGGGGAVASLP